MVESGRHGRRLTVVPPELHELQARVARRELRQPRVRLVTAAVVDDDDLVRAPERIESVPQRVVQRADVVLLVVHGNDDRELGSVTSVGSATA